MNAAAKDFTGVGTILTCDVASLASSLSATPQFLVKKLKRYQQLVQTAIDARSGVVSQYVGAAVLAYWHPQHLDPNHAQLAFDASCDILKSWHEDAQANDAPNWSLNIVLGTGDMAGTVFGPTRQFQIIGMAAAVADRIYKSPRVEGSSIRMSQYTWNLIEQPSDLLELANVSRENLENLRIFSYAPFQKSQSR